MAQDIEGFEYKLLMDIVRSGRLLPEQAAVEVHWQVGVREVPWFGRLYSPFEIAAWMEFMFTHGGYMLVDRNDEPSRYRCTQHGKRLDKFEDGHAAPTNAHQTQKAYICYKPALEIVIARLAPVHMPVPVVQ